MNKTIAVCLVVGVLVIGGIGAVVSLLNWSDSEKPALTHDDSQIDKLPVLMPVPEFSLTDQSGESFGSDQLLGRV